MGNFRKGGPPINILRKVNLPRYEKNILDNGLPLYSVSMGTQDIIKLEVVFFSGRPYEAKKVVSRACNSQIKEGSLDLNSKQISEEIDFYGATLRTSEDLDSCSISLFCLNKYFDKLLPIFHEIVTTPQFPADELRKFIKNNVERLKVDLTKNDVIAYRTLTEKVFSKEHPYGYNSEIDDYRALVKEDLVSHYKNNYGYNNSNIFISGKVNDTHITLCNKYFGRQFQICTPNESIPLIQKSIPENLHIKSGKEFQTAIKMGRRLFDRQHEDYAGLYILNAVFGGYFGSRLMSNIREDKGYTYNIYSEVDVMKHDGIFIIGTEVSDEYVNKTKKEISKEIDKIKLERIPSQELDMVRNYLLGRILNFVDGPFNASRLIKSILLSDLDKSYFEKLVGTIRDISSEELRDLANKYLIPENMWSITVGK